MSESTNNPVIFSITHSLKLQIGLALASLIALFVYFSIHTLSILEEQRTHGALLRLAGELQITAQHMGMKAMTYQDNAPADQAAYTRDLEIYYEDLMRNTEQFGSVCQAFSTGNFENQLQTHESMTPMLSQVTMDAAFLLEDYWNGYMQKLKSRLGSNKMPNLQNAANFIVSSNQGLSQRTKDLLNALDTDISNRTATTNNVIRVSFLIALLLTCGIMLWFYLQVLKPLNLAIIGFKEAANGNFDHQIPITSKTEIGWLTQAFNQLSKRLGTMFQLISRLQEGSDLDETLAFVTKSFPELLPLDWVGVLFVTDDAQMQLEKSYSDGKPDNQGAYKFPLQGTLLEDCMASGEPLHIPDIQEVSALNPSYQFLKMLGDRKRRDAIFLPVTSHSPIPGVLVFATRQAHAYKREHLELLSNLALVITISFGRTMKLAKHARLAAIGEFASGIAHEIRTPLATVGMALDYFQDTDLPENAAKRARLANTEMSRINRLLEDMLLYAKPLRLRIEDIDIAAEIQTAINSLQEKIQQKALNIALSHSSQTNKIPMDRDRWLQVMLNLIQNAIEAAPENSTINIEIKDSTDQQFLEISVRNQGAPLTEQQQSRLFEPFFTTKSSGTGLGLAIVRRLVEAHDGVIDVVSDAELGIVFIIKLRLV